MGTAAICRSARSRVRRAVHGGSTMTTSTRRPRRHLTAGAAAGAGLLPAAPGPAPAAAPRAAAPGAGAGLLLAPTVAAPAAPARAAAPGEAASPAALATASTTSGLQRPGSRQYLRRLSTPATGWVAPRPLGAARVSAATSTFVVT